MLNIGLRISDDGDGGSAQTDMVLPITNFLTLRGGVKSSPYIVKEKLFISDDTHIHDENYPSYQGYDTHSHNGHGTTESVCCYSGIYLGVDLHLPLYKLWEN